MWKHILVTFNLQQNEDYILHNDISPNFLQTIFFMQKYLNMTQAWLHETVPFIYLIHMHLSNKEGTSKWCMQRNTLIHTHCLFPIL